jgi:hypothetical protein
MLQNMQKLPLPHAAGDDVPPSCSVRTYSTLLYNAESNKPYKPRTFNPRPHRTQDRSFRAPHIAKHGPPPKSKYPNHTPGNCCFCAHRPAQLGSSESVTSLYFTTFHTLSLLPSEMHIHTLMLYVQSPWLDTVIGRCALISPPEKAFGPAHWMATRECCHSSA